MFKKLSLPIGLFLALFISACATGVPNTSIESLNGEIPVGTGIVVAETLNNSTRITGPIKRWKQIVIWKMDAAEDDENKTFTINSLSHSLSTQAYMGAVPAGTYRIGMLFSYLSTGDISYSARALMPPMLGTFEVKPGQVTNLGVIMYQPFQAKGWHEESYPDYAATRIASPDLWESSSEYQPEIRNKIDPSLPILGWNPDKFDAARAEAAQLIRAAAIPKNIHTLKDGSYLLTGLLGGLYAQNQGNWQNYSLDTHYEIVDLAELSTGQLLLGSELGTLLLTDSQGNNARSISMGEGLKHVVDIDTSATGNVYVLTYGNDLFEVFKFDESTQELVLSKGFPKKINGFWADAYNTGVSSAIALGLENGIAIYMDKMVHRYNESTDQWTAEKAIEFLSLSQQLDGVIKGIPFGIWDGSKPLTYSVDGGKNWNKTTENIGFFEVRSSVPTYRFADGELLKTGKGVKRKFFYGWDVKEKLPVITSTDDGKNWEVVGGVALGCEKISEEASTDALVYVLCEDGSVVTSTDRGRNWVVSLENRLPVFDAFPENLKLKYEREE